MDQVETVSILPVATPVAISNGELLIMEVEAQVQSILMKSVGVTAGAMMTLGISQHCQVRHSQLMNLQSN